MVISKWGPSTQRNHWKTVRNACRDQLTALRPAHVWLGTLCDQTTGVGLGFIFYFFCIFIKLTKLVLQPCQIYGWCNTLSNALKITYTSGIHKSFNCKTSIMLKKKNNTILASALGASVLPTSLSSMTAWCTVVSCTCVCRYMIPNTYV